MSTELMAINNQVAQQQINNLSINFNDPAIIQCLRTTVAKGATDSELSYFLALAKTKNLNPFNKEIYFSAYGTGEFRKFFVMVGRHGMLTLAENHPDFRGLKSCEIRENDDFEFNPIEQKITKHNVKGGKIIGAWAIAKRSNRDDVCVVCWLDEYIKIDTKKNEPTEVWRKYTQDMIKFKAEKRALEQQFRSEYKGLMVESDEETDYRFNEKQIEDTHSPSVYIANPADMFPDEPQPIKDFSRMFAIMKEKGLTRDDAKALLIDAGLIVESSKELTTDTYDIACNIIQNH